MRTLLLSLALLSACGPVDAEELAPTVAVAQTPNVVDVLPAGWFLHYYPALCAVAVRDEAGTLRACYDYWPGPCKPSTERRCSAITE